MKKTSKIVSALLVLSMSVSICVMPAAHAEEEYTYDHSSESFVAGNKGYASAIVVWTVLLIGLVTLVQFIGQKKWVNYEV